MNARKTKTKKERLKKAAQYGSAATGVAVSIFDVVGIFIAIPGFIKWATVALIGALAAAVSCCVPDNVNAVADPGEALRECKEVESDLAEMKKELEYHHQILAAAIDAKDETKLAGAQSHAVERLNNLTQAHLHKRGLFATRSSVPLPAVPLEIHLENLAAEFKMTA